MLSFGERHLVACSYRSRRFDHGVDARAGELAGAANLNPVVLHERPQHTEIRR
jgi:hypothetical protein